MKRPHQYESVLSAWQEQVAEAVKAPRQQLLLRERDLLPRFAAHYTKLKALPRRARRSLQRKWKQPLAGVALLLALGQAPALAATINVDGKTCTLVDAITAANTDTETGGCRKGSEADTLVLRAGSTHTLTAVNNSTSICRTLPPPYGPVLCGPTGLPVVATEITIAGNGSTIARSTSTGTPDFRLLAVSETGDLTLADLTLTGGAASGMTFPGDFGGGALSAGIVTITNSTVTGNTSSGEGGGVYHYGSTLSLINSTVSDNTAGGFGGGIRSVQSDNARDTTEIIDSTISGNTGGEGGGLNTYGGIVRIIRSTISGNSSDSGGGGMSHEDNLRVRLVDSTVANNTAAGGGGLRLNCPVSNCTMALTNSTVSDNTADGDGGGIVVVGNEGVMKVTNSTLTGNTAADGGGMFNGENRAPGTVSLFRTLISGNTASSGAEIYNETGSTIAVDTFNLFGHRGLTNAQAFVNFTPGAGDITATSDGTKPTVLTAILDTTLQNNGGPTDTHALVSRSPAIDAVTDGSCPPPNTDQRGVLRPDGDGDSTGRCDVGAVEIIPPGITCDGRAVTMVGTSASDMLTGTPSRDVIHGLRGNDTIKGLRDDDVLCGGRGQDALSGNRGDDRLFGQRDNDALDGGRGSNFCNGGRGRNTATRCDQVINVP